MTRAPAPIRYILCVILLVVGAACRRSRGEAPFAVVDMVREFDRAEKRPAAGFQITDYAVGGVVRRSILIPAPSRLIWSFPLPRHGRFRAFLATRERGSPATAVRFRFGVSDLRIYEGLAEYTLTSNQSAWVDFGADLSAYAGFKVSLFYHPDSVLWRVVLAADVIGDGPVSAVWGSPEIVTDFGAAKEYAARRQQLR